MGSICVCNHRETNNTKLFNGNLKVHETIPNDDFERITALEHCFEMVSTLLHHYNTALC